MSPPSQHPSKTQRRHDLGSWSRIPMATAISEEQLTRGSVAESIAAPRDGASLPRLARGAGRSYGDTAVIGEGESLSTSALKRVLQFDPEIGEVDAEAGVTLDEINARIRSDGWIVPSCPGTASVTLGGMVASDVHGKNHVHTGTIGEHVLELSLVRSDRGAVTCSPSESPDLFRATIGGLGLTGVIERVRLKLAPLAGSLMQVERTRCRDIDTALELLRETELYDYGFAWIDSFSVRPRRGGGTSARCVVLRGRVLPDDARKASARRGTLRVIGALGQIAPPALFRRITMRAVNRAYFAGSGSRTFTRSVDGFLFPQDDAHSGNRIYGARGVYGHHSLIPTDRDGALHELLQRSAESAAQSLVTVLKVFGGEQRNAPGMLSFTGSGTSVALGFPNEGEITLAQLDALDAIVLDAGGKLYPAKDARMPAASFARSFPLVGDFVRHVDPSLSSNFWRRVAPGADA